MPWHLIYTALLLLVGLLVLTQLVAWPRLQRGPLVASRPWLACLAVFLLSNAAEDIGLISTGLGHALGALGALGVLGLYAFDKWLVRSP